MKRRAFVRSTVGAAATLPLLDGSRFFHRILTQDPGDITAVRGDGTKVTIRGARVLELARAHKGPVLLARSKGYDTARMVLNPVIDKRPALIAQPGSDADVQRAVAFAAEHRLLTAVKCGGHSFSGQSTCDDGLMIDLSGLRGVRIDAGARRVQVKGGSLLGAVDEATRPHGLVTPLGTVSHTGVGGLTTGGGFGRVARRFGLALDNLTAVEVVTADGRLLRASADENADLFWGVRGGGGNFGVVTSFEFRLHEMNPEVIGGDIVFPFARARDLLRHYAEIDRAAGDDLYLDFAMMLPPGGADGMCSVNVCYSGPPAGADRALAPLRKFGTPLQDGIKAVPYVELQRSADVSDPRASGSYLKSGFTSEISDDLVRAIIGGFEPHPGRATILFTQHCGGAIARVPVDATSFAHRYARFNVLAVAGWPAAADATPHMAAIRTYWSGIEGFTRGWYTNEVSDETATVVNANYGPNYPRLVAVKTKYDPGNLFRLNANVQPGA